MQSTDTHDFLRLMAVSSPSTRIAQHIKDLTPISGSDIPTPLQELELPAGWQPATLGDYGETAARTAVRVPASSADGFGFETLAVYKFTGLLRPSTVMKYADTTLRDLNASAISTGFLTTPPQLPDVTAVCSTGHVNISGFAVWAQYCTYAAGSAAPHRGLLLEHALLVDNRWRNELAADVDAISRGLLTAFLVLT